MSLFQPTRLFISSDDKISGTHNDFTVELPDSIIGAKAALVSFACVPNLTYNFGAHQTTLYFKLNTSLPVVGSVTPTSPNTVLSCTVAALSTSYVEDISGLAARVNTALNTAVFVHDDAANPSIVGLQVTAAGQLAFSLSNPDSKKLSFTSGSGCVFMGWNQPNTPYYNNLSYWLGFPNPATPPSGTWWSNATQYAAGGYPVAFPSLLRTQNIYILSDFTTGDNQGTSGRKDVLVKLPITPDVVPGGVVQFEDSIGHWSITRLPSAIRRMRFQVCDDDYMPLGIPDEGPGGVSVEVLLKYSSN